MKGIGTEFRVGDGAGPEVFTAVAEVIEMPSYAPSREAHDDTTFDVPDGYKRFSPGSLTDPGEMTLVLKYNPDDADHVALIDLIDSGALTNCQVYWPNTGGTAVTETFAAFVTSTSKETPLDGNVTRSVTLKVSGKPTRS